MVTLQLDNLVAAPHAAPVTVRVPAGELAVVVADPATGTAVARAVAGLATPLGGRVLVGDRDVTTLPPARRQIGYVPAGAGLLPHLTVRRNIGYGHRRRLRVRAVADDWVNTVIERLELGLTLEVLPHELSEPQRFRVAVARAAACLPEVLVVDLPSGGGGVDRLGDLLVDLAPEDSPGIATLICSADPVIVDRVDEHRRYAVERVGSVRR
ncbi:ATP-binding cassette domain-containing protein [Plantactinospora sp. GCM10030261]|uniref:ATP-binding cassette domain-containing protein n=1 Tax=Plantactinospora sp. GCM10030261 TaxID=3273420 RepID=UPI00360D6E60